MSKTIQWKRGNVAASSGYTGPAGEITVETGSWNIRVHDGLTPGGHPISTDENSVSESTGVFLANGSIRSEYRTNADDPANAAIFSNLTLSSGPNAAVVIRGFNGSYIDTIVTNIPVWETNANGALVVYPALESTTDAQLYYISGNVLSKVQGNVIANANVAVTRGTFDTTTGNLGNTNPVISNTGNVVVDNVTNTADRDIYLTSAGVPVAYADTQPGDFDSAAFISNLVYRNQFRVYIRGRQREVIRGINENTGNFTLGNVLFQNNLVTTTYQGNTDVYVYGNIIPGVDGNTNTAGVGYSLGTQQRQWRDLWVSSSTIYIGGAAVGVRNSVANRSNIELTINNVSVATKEVQTRVDSNGQPLVYPNGSPVTYTEIAANTFVANDANISGNLTTGNITADSASFTDLRANNIVLDGTSSETVDTVTANITGLANINSANVLTANITTATITTGNIDQVNSVNVSATGNLAVSGDAVINGNLTVLGEVVTMNTSTITLEDLNITLGNGAVNAQQANGAGFTIAGANVGLTYLAANNTQQFSSNVDVNAALSSRTFNTTNATVATNLIVGATYITNNRLHLAPGSAAAAPQTGTPSPGRRIITEENFNGTDQQGYVENGIDAIGYAIGQEAGHMWFGTDLPSNPLGSDTRGFKWYGHTNQAARLSAEGNLFITGHITTAANVLAGNLTANANATVTGNLTAGNILGGNAGLGNITAVTLTTTGNISTDATITAANLIAVANIEATGNITGSYIFANGAFITGLPAGYSNADVDLYLPNYAGNISNANAIVSQTLTTLGNANVAGNLLTTNIRAATLNTTGNITTAANAAIGNIATGIIAAATLNTTGNITTTANAAIGNIATGIITATTLDTTGNITTAANAAIGNIATGIIAAATLNTTGNITTTANAAIGNIATGIIAAATLNTTGNITTTANAAIGNIATGIITATTLDTTGNITTAANAAIGNIATGISEATTLIATGNITSTANVAGGNLLATENIIAVANITGNMIIGNGALLTGLAAGYDNTDVDAYLPTYAGNINANVITALTINTTDIVIEGNLLVRGNTTTLNTEELVVNDYNIIIANAATTATEANGAGITINGANVGIVYRQSLDAIDINRSLRVDANITTGPNSFIVANNITANANIRARGFFIGNGSQLEGIDRTRIERGSTVVRVSEDQSVTFRSNFYTQATSNVVVIEPQGNIIANGNITGNFIFGNVRNATGFPAGYDDIQNAQFLANNTGNISAGNLRVIDSLTINGSVINTTLENAVSRARWAALRVLRRDSTDYTGQDIATVANTIAATLTSTQALALDFFANVYEITTSGSYRVINNYSTTTVIYDNDTDNWFTWNGSGWVDASYGDSDVDSHILTAGVTTGANVQAGNLRVVADATLNNLVTNVNISTGNLSATSTVAAAALTATGNVGANNATITNAVTADRVTALGNVTGGNILGVGVYANAYYQWVYNTTTTEWDAYPIGDRFNEIDAAFGNSTMSRLVHYANNDIRDGAISPTTLEIFGNGSIGFTTGNTGRLLFANTSASDLSNVLTVTGSMGVTGGIVSQGNIGTVGYYYGNIRTATGGFANANVAVYLAANVDTTILNINSAIGNNYSNITTLQNQVYANANVAEYLPDHTGNVRAGNLTVDQSVDILGNLTVTGVTTYNNTAQLTVTDKLIVVANGAISNAAANGGGIFVEHVNASITYSATDSRWVATNGFESQGIFKAPVTDFTNLVANAATVWGNIRAGNISSNVLISANTLSLTANATAGYYFGNGSQLSGVNFYSNANVDSYLPIYTGNIQTGNMTVTGSTFITGNLQVVGTTTTVNQVDLEVQNKTITLSSGAVNNQAADESGMVIDFVNASILWDNETDTWRSNRGFTVTQGNITAVNRIFTEVLSANANITSNGNIVTIANVIAGNITTGNIVSNTTTLLRSDLTDLSTAVTANVTRIDANISNVNVTLSNAITVVSTRLNTNTATLTNSITNVNTAVSTLSANVHAHQAHMIYKVAGIDDTNYVALNLSLEDVATAYQADLFSNAAIAVNSYNQIVEFGLDGAFTILKDYAIGLTIVTNNDNNRYSWSGTEWELNFNRRIRDALLLGSGFILLTEGNTTGTRTAYTGSIIGEPTTTYYFDSNSSAWFDAVTGGNLIIAFPA